MSAPVGLCVVGAGGIAALHMRTLSELGAFRNLWVVDRTTERAASFGAEWGFEQQTTEIEEALADPDVGLVLIASPSELHSSQALLALDAGKHVVVEIPVAMSADDAEAVAALAREVGRRAFVCHTLRSFPAIQWLRERVVAGSLAVSQVAGFVAVPRRRNDHWAGGTRDWVDSLLWHNACHYIDAGLWVIDATDVTRTSCHYGRRHDELRMTMDIALSCTTSREELLLVTATYNTASSQAHMRFVTDEALFELRGRRLTRDDGSELFPGSSEPVDVAAQDRTIVKSLLEEEPSDFDVDRVLPTMHVLQVAQLDESLRSLPADG